jgi:multidrug efflux pump subunit AcrA (membrane-fusion protein)
MNGNLDVVVNRLPGAISVPAKALFTRNGKPIVYISANKTYSPKEVELLARNPDEVAIKGLNAGDLVTLTEPPAETKQ